MSAATTAFGDVKPNGNNSPPPWGSFVGDVRVISSRPCWSAVFDTIGSARNSALVAKFVTDSAFGQTVSGSGLASLRAIVAEYASEPVLLVVESDTKVGNSVCAVAALSGRKLYSRCIRGVVSMCVDPTNGSMIVGTNRALFRLSCGAAAQDNDSIWEHATMTPVAGSDAEDAIVDGSLSDARFSNAVVECCSVDGEIAVTDKCRRLIRIIDPRIGRVTTVAEMNDAFGYQGCAFDPLHRRGSAGPSNIYAVKS